MAGIEVATAYVSVVPNTRGFGRELMNKANPQMGSAGSSLGSTLAFGLKGALVAGAAAAAAAAAAAITAGIKAGVDYNAMLEQRQISFEVMLGGKEAAAQMIADIQQFAAKTPFEFPEISDAATKALAYGFAPEQIMPMLTDIGNAAAGLGMGGEGMAIIGRALGQMQTLGKVNARDMLQLTEAGIPAWQMLADKMGISTQEVMKLSEQGLLPADQAIQDLLDGMSERFPDMMEKQSQTFTGMWSTIKDNANIALGQLTKPIFEAIKDIMPPVIDFLERIGRGEGLGGMFANIFGPNAQAQFGDLKDTIADLGTTVMPTIRGWYDNIIKPTMDEIAEAWKPAFEELMPTIETVIAFVRDNWPYIKEAIEPVMTSVKNTISGAMKMLGGLLRADMAIIRGDWGAAWEGVKTAFSGVVDVLKGSTIGMALSAVAKTFDVALRSIKTYVYEHVIMPLNLVIDTLNRIAGTNFARIRMSISGVTGALTVATSASGTRQLIPGAAQGGLLSGPKSGYLALLHGTELVTPYDKVGASGHTFNFYGTSRADIPYIESAVRRVLRGDVRSAGSLAYGGI